MNNLSRSIVLSAVALSLTACTLQSSQLSAIVELLKNDSSDISVDYWRLDYKGASHFVVPVVAGNYTVFANNKGIAVAFDGWSIRLVNGLGDQIIIQATAAQSDDGLAGRVYTIRGLETAHSCAAWESFEEQGVIWRQLCQGVASYQNRIDIDPLGRVSEIVQVVTPRGDVLALRRGR
jgi:hypothetical protein